MTSDDDRKERLSSGKPSEEEACSHSSWREDLNLARACAKGDEAAWETFLTRYRDKLYRFALGMAKEQSTARELADGLLADLFGTRLTSQGQRISKLESYSGRGPLEAWLKTVLAQQYVNRFRAQRKLVSFDEAIGAEKSSDEAEFDSESRARLAGATDTALAGVSAEERFLLATYYLDGRTLADISRMLGVHESTISRRIDKITTKLRKRVIKELCRSGLPKPAAEQMLHLDVKQLEIDVAGRLAQETEARGVPGLKASAD